MGYAVNGCKMTGTASLKDILHMNDAGAKEFADFTYLGHPSTYKLSLQEMLDTFHTLDGKLGSNGKNYLVVEFADGINQRETAMLLECPEIVSRIHKLIFCAADALGAVGGIHVLKTKFNLVPDAISGVCSSSPLHIRELNNFTDLVARQAYCRTDRGCRRRARDLLQQDAVDPAVKRYVPFWFACIVKIAHTETHR